MRRKSAAIDPLPASGRNIRQRYKTIVLYLVFGGLTSLLNITVYWGLAAVWGFYYLAASTMAWAASVLFAYITNRSFVFVSRSNGLIYMLGECASFFACRFLSGLLDTAGMYVMISLLHCHDLSAKLSVSIAVVILNYMLSKQVVFKREDQDEVSAT